MKVLIFVSLCIAFAGAPSSRVTGGEGAVRRQFPYVVAVEWGALTWQQLCVGILVGSSWVLTAGNCITEAPSGGSFRIRAGVINLSDDNDSDDVQVATVASIFVHPDYAGGISPHDIALLQLSTSLRFTGPVQWVLLAAANSVATGTGTLIGWGSTSTSTTPVFPDTLQFVQVTLLTQDECAEALTALNISPDLLSETNICSGPLTGGISACTGDSGGPLVQIFLNAHILIGVVSWALTPCGSVGAPSVYTQISSYIEWIEGVIAENS